MKVVYSIELQKRICDLYGELHEFGRTHEQIKEEWLEENKDDEIKRRKPPSYVSRIHHLCDLENVLRVS